MRQYGLVKMVSGHRAKKDYHARPKRIYRNWWESICAPLPRTTIKARTRNEILDALEFMKWKYQVITEEELRRLVDDGHPFTSIYEQEALCKCGELGWELVQILVANSEKMYYFKQAMP